MFLAFFFGGGYMKECVLDYDPEMCPIEEGCRYWNKTWEKCLFREMKAAEKEARARGKAK